MVHCRKLTMVTTLALAIIVALPLSLFAASQTDKAVSSAATNAPTVTKSQPANTVTQPNTTAAPGVQNTGPSQAATPGTQPAAPDPAATKAPIDAPEQYAACSPQFPAEQIADMVAFVAQISPELPDKVRPILLKCDLNVNSQLLEFLERIQEEVALVEFDDDAQEKLYLQEKTKQIEAELILLNKPINDANLKLVVGQLFELRQQGLKQYIERIQKDLDEAKTRVAKRESNKEKIVDKKAKELIDIVQGGSKAENPEDDDMDWE